MSLHLERERYLPSTLRSDHFTDPGKSAWGQLFTKLWDRFGDPYWWPGRDAWEVAAGAVLTQNTSWVNVTTALAALRDMGWTSASAILSADQERLSQVIRPAGYFNQKARKLLGLAQWWVERVETGEAARLGDSELREELLSLWGVGPETADAIACYALGRVIFVVDAYTLRMMQRLRGMTKPPLYEVVQEEVHRELPADPMLLNHLHGLIVVLGKEHCTSRDPECAGCPLKTQCAFAME